MSIAAYARTGGQVHRHANGGELVGRRIVTGSAIKGVGTRRARQDVVIGVPGQRVVMGRAVDIFDIGQGVARGIAAEAGAGREVDGHGGRGRAVYGGIGPHTAVEIVRTRAADQLIVAGARTERVGARISGQDIVMGRALEVLDVGQTIAVGVTTAGGRGQQIDGHAGRGLQICRGIHVGAAVERIRARAAVEIVVPGRSVDGVVAGKTTNGIAGRCSVQRVIAVGGDRHAGEQSGVTPARPAIELEGLDTVARIRYGLVDHDAIAVRSDVDHQIVGVGRPVGQREIGGRDAGAEDDFVGTATGLVDQIGTVAEVENVGIVGRAADEIIVAFAAGQGVGAGAAMQAVVAGSAGDRIRLVGADDDVIARGGRLVEQLGAQIRPTPCRPAVERDGLDGVAHGVQRVVDHDAVAARADVDDQIVAVGRAVGEREVGGGNPGAKGNRVGAARLVDQIGAVAEIEDVGVVMAAANEVVIARPPGQSVGTGVAVQTVVARAAGDRIRLVGAGNDVVARGGCLVEQFGPQVRPTPARAAIEIDGLDGVAHGVQRVVDHDAVGAAHADVDDQVVTVRAAVGQRQVGGGDAGSEEDRVGAARARLVDQIGAVAEVEDVGVVMGAADEVIVARAAL